MKMQWYEEFFQNYAETYDKEIFTQGTVGEVQFIEQEIGFDKSKKILDIGCGTGRHDIELARRGYTVTGVDLSTSQLERARLKARDAGVSVEFRQADARELEFDNEFDTVILICEGAFPLMETDEMNCRILANAARALKSKGKFILTTLNALFPLMKNSEQFLTEGGLSVKISGFDVLTLREHSEVERTDDSGVTSTIRCTDRYYMPSEIHWYLSTLGFTEIGIFGCRLGEFSREHILTANDFEMLVTAVKA